MSAIKRFFEKKKLDAKFLLAGQGQSLKEEAKPPPRPTLSQPTVSLATRTPTEEQLKAAEAAHARLQNPRHGTASGQHSSAAAIKAQVKRELELEKQQQDKIRRMCCGPNEVQLEASEVLTSAVGNVLYTCSLIPEKRLPKKDMEELIQRFLEVQLTEDAELASALLIHTVNNDKEKVKVGMETLCKYLDNIIANPMEEKFRRIRCSNKVFAERVAALGGTKEFLQCAGFVLSCEPDGEAVYKMSAESAADTARLCSLKEVLMSAEPIRAELDRALKVFRATGHLGTSFGEVPRDFYNISPEELKREQQLRQEAVEKMGMLRTKAMRERDEIRELRKYRYTLIRVRFPEDIFVQAIFKTTETLSSLKTFISGLLQHAWLPFSLMIANGQKVLDEERSLAELQLAPAALLIFTCDTTLLKDAHTQTGSSNTSQILSDATLLQMELSPP